MAIDDLKKLPQVNGGRNPMIMPIIVFWSLVIIGLLTYAWLEIGVSGTYPGMYLIPWVFIASICVLGPSVYLLYKGRFDFFHPLIYAAWVYCFPAFVVGGLIIAFGLVNPYFLTFIEDPDYNLPLSLVYVSVGFIGLTVGFAIPVGKYFAGLAEPRLPNWQWDSNGVWLPAFLLLFAGIGINLFGLVQGIMGFQRITETGIFDSLLVFLLIVLSVGYVLLWLAIFNVRARPGIYYIAIVVAVIFIPLRMALLGSRSGLLISILPIAMAFQYSGRKLKMKYVPIFATLVIGSVCLGMVYGTAFRRVKGSEARINAGEYFGLVLDTLDQLSTEDPAVIAEESFQALLDRVENLSSLGVVVANYEKLAPYEASYGLENNIINDAMTSFIPRFVWADKPNTSDPRAYSELYFNFGENSFAISPFGDLLRNFGPIGVPIGMLVLGIYFRLIYTALIDTPNPAMWKKVAYFPLLTLVSYEGFYAVILPSLIRTVFVLVIALFIINLLSKRKRITEFRAIAERA